MTSQAHHALLETVAAKVREAGVFAEVSVEGARLTCTARDADAAYRIDCEPEGRVLISLVTADRWLSESIETELLHSGDKIEELLEDELADLGWEGTAMEVQHFRSEDLLFTFRSALCFDDESPAEAAAAVTICLLAYQACFRELGDMSGAGGD